MQIGIIGLGRMGGNIVRRLIRHGTRRSSVTETRKTRVLANTDLPATRAYAEGDPVWLVDPDAAPEQRDVA